jgi:hypothetical protein
MLPLASGRTPEVVASVSPVIDSLARGWGVPVVIGRQARRIDDRLIVAVDARPPDRDLTVT